MTAAPSTPKIKAPPPPPESRVSKLHGGSTYQAEFRRQMRERCESLTSRIESSRRVLEALPVGEARAMRLAEAIAQWEIELQETEQELAGR